MLKLNYDFEIYLYHTRTCKIELFKRREKVTPQMIKPEIAAHKRKEERFRCA